MRIPRPPPPAAALTISGKRSSPSPAHSTMSSSLRPGRSMPGTVATPASAASSLAATLSPSLSLASGGGPTNTRPASAQARANEARSERKP
jgi:hypothetical protein